MGIPDTAINRARLQTYARDSVNAEMYNLLIGAIDVVANFGAAPKSKRVEAAQAAAVLPG